MSILGMLTAFMVRQRLVQLRDVRLRAKLSVFDVHVPLGVRLQKATVDSRFKIVQPPQISPPASHAAGSSSLPLVAGAKITFGLICPILSEK